MRDINLEDTIYPKFTTRAFATGIPTTLAGTPVLSIYEENNLTQITAGVSVTVDYDTVAGLNQATIVATSANGYEAGKSYDLVITTGTVGGVSVVGEVVFSFTVEAAWNEADVTKWLGTTVATPTTAGVPTTALSAIGLDAIPSTATGMVEIAKAIWDRILTGATHNIATSAGRRLRGIQENGSVYNGKVHVDTNNGVTGVVPYENGTSDNTVLTWAEALIIAPAVNGGLSDFHMINGSSITLTANTDNKSLFGDNYSVALGGQSCADIYIEGASVSGTGTAATGEMHFEGCNFGTSSVQSGHFDFCAFANTITATLTGGYQYHNCYSGVPGAGAPIFTKTAGQTITSEWRNWAGSITVSTIESGDVMTIGGTLGTVTLNGADGSVEIRGSYKSIVDNRTGSPALNVDGAIQSDALVDLVWDEAVSGHTTAGSFGKLVKNSTDIVQLDGAISDAGPLTTDFDTDLTGYGDGYFEDSILVFTDGAANKGIGLPVNGYTSATGNFQFTAPDDWPVTPVNTDPFVIYAIHVHPISQIQAGLATEAKQDIIDTNVDNLGLGIIYGAAVTGTLSTTQATSDLTGYADDQLIGRTIIWTSGAAEGEGTDITDYASASGLLTFTALTIAPANGNTFKIV
jgi:hypothetical protein